MSKSALLLSASALMIAGPVFAQEPSTRGGLEEIIVTAQKRAENVQDVPIAVTALSGEDLQARGVTEITQLANFTPSVQLSNSSQIVSSPSSLSGFIRGIGQDDFSGAFEPGVGTYVDGVYLARTVGANANLLDVERVEILKGPQGTLFGRNTIGGAINVVTRAPAKERSIRGQITAGEFNRTDVGIAVDLPLVDDVLLSNFAISYSQRDGYQKRIPFTGAGGVNSETIADFVPGGAVLGVDSGSRQGGGEELNARMKLLWAPSDDLRVTLAGDYGNAKQDASSFSLIKTAQTANGAPTLAGLYNICINTPAGVLSGIGLGPVCGPRLGIGTGLAGVNVDADPSNDLATYDDRYVTNDPDTNYNTGNNYADLRTYGFAATIDYDLTESIALKSITAYRDQSWKIGLDIDGSPAIIFEPTIEQKQHQFSQEVQFSGKAIDGRLDWLVGGYYFDEGTEEEQNPIFAGGLFQVVNPIAFDTKSLAFFTHLNFDLTEQLSVTLGARYTEEEKEFSPSQRDANLFLQKLLGLPAFLYANPADLTELMPTSLQKQSFDNFSPRVGVEYKPFDEMMVYASYSEGYKSGGWTTRVTAPVQVAPTFDEETAKTIEVGVKSQFFDRRLQVNAAAFRTDYEGMQLSIQRGISPTFENAGDSEITGFEVEAQAIITDAFRIDASAGYIKAEYVRVDDPTGIITLDSDLPKVPEFTAHIAPEYRINLPNEASLTLRADYSYRSKAATDTENTPELYSDAVSLVDLAVTYTAPDEAWSIIAGGKNVTDERYIVNGTNQLGGAGTMFAVYNRPAEWFLSFRFKM